MDQDNLPLKIANRDKREYTNNEVTEEVKIQIRKNNRIKRCI